MKRPVRPFALLVGAVALLATGMTALQAPSGAIVAGAGYTTGVDVNPGDGYADGCLDNRLGINCNNYTAKTDVYMSGGPLAGGLSDGEYYFAVLNPGFQNGGFADGAQGNLSDTTAAPKVKGKATPANDRGTGDLVGNRTFTVTDKAITSYEGTHLSGTSPNGKRIIQLANYDDTDNAGGVYILAICQAGATSPSQCKFDAFKVKTKGRQTNPFGTLSGLKYYDANANGQYDSGEVGIANWAIDYANGVSGTLYTTVDGTFSAQFLPGTYTLTEQQRAGWIQTGNTVDQTADAGGNTSTLAGFAYTATVVADGSTTGLNFGNVCVGAGGGHTPGFWSNNNGQALFGTDDLALVNDRNNADQSGLREDFDNYDDFERWLLDGNAVNMSYMLSVHAAAMALNVHNGFVSGTALVYAPGTGSANGSGFATINHLLGEANTAVAANPDATTGDETRDYLEALKNALDNANNNLNFIQASPASCA